MLLYALFDLLRGGRVWRKRDGWPVAAGIGAIRIIANICVLLAFQRTAGFSVVVTIVSLHPVTTVLLALVILKEKLRPIQLAGLAAAAGAIILIAGFAKAH